jgi:hypothetical protein
MSTSKCYFLQAPLTPFHLGPNDAKDIVLTICHKLVLRVTLQNSDAAKVSEG